jgi:MerR family mercuric resistance operon transcriptional regulator
MSQGAGLGAVTLEAEMARRRTIGRLAAEAGVNVETVRYYERRGILERPPAQQGGRTYGDEALWRIRYIKTAQGWGLSLKAVIGLLADAEASPNFCAAVRATAAAKIVEIDQEIAALRRQRLALSTFIGACAAKPDAERCPVYRRMAAAR